MENMLPKNDPSRNAALFSRLRDLNSALRQPIMHRIYSIIMALAVLCCAQDSHLWGEETASKVNAGGTGTDLSGLSGKINRGDSGALDMFYDGTAQSRKLVKGPPAKGPYYGEGIDTKTLREQDPELPMAAAAPPSVEDAKEEDKDGNPKFNKVNCTFWIFGCQQLDEVRYEEYPGDLFVGVKDDTASVDTSDIAQGGIGDCYYLSAMAAIVRKDPKAVSDRIRQNADGTYSVDFYRKRNFWELWKPEYTKETVTVDNKFPVNKYGGLLFAHYGDRADNEGRNPELWVMVMEKAYAKFRGSYNDIGSGGVGGSAMEDLTGKDSSTHLAAFTSLDQLAEWENKGYAVTACSMRAFGTKEEVVKSHVYYVMAVDTEKRTVTMGNPWGYNHVTLTENEFQRNYFTVYANPIQ